MDLPLHDFTPQTEEDFERLLKDLPHLDRAQVELVAATLHEHNPMLGLRACRYGILKPEVYDMQIRAIVRAAYAVDGKIKPGILFPLVLMETELRVLRERVRKLEEQVRETLRIPVSSKLEFKVGAMIELPGAALNADKLAQVGDFFAFGTNDLTQTTLGISRDDSAHYLPFYLEKELITSDPFRVLSEPVRELVETAVRRGRRVRPDSSFGICGEQGGDRATLEFCLKKGLNYVSCSPFRVLLTKLALIQVAAKILPRAEVSESQTPSTLYKGGSGPSPKQAQVG
jgi:pyruvate,orthophosphate dikinase